MDSNVSGKSPRKYRHDEDDGGFANRDISKSSHHSSNPDISARSVGVSAKGSESVGVSARVSESVGVSAKSPNSNGSIRGTPGFAYVNPKDLEASFSQYSMFGRSVDPTYHGNRQRGYHGNQHRGGRHRTRDYDSDTGYRSETDVVRYQRQQIIAHHNERRGYESECEARPSRRRAKDGYSSDLDSYQGHSRDIAYRGVQIHQQHNANSLPYDLNNSQRQLNQTPHSSNPRINMAGNDMYSDGNHRNSGYTDGGTVVVGDPYSGADRTLPPPSPGQFHRSKIVDQSTPTTTEPPEVFPPGGGSDRSRSNSASGSQDDGELRVVDQRGDVYSGTREYPSRSTPVSVTHKCLLLY